MRGEGHNSVGSAEVLTVVQQGSNEDGWNGDWMEEY